MHLTVFRVPTTHDVLTLFDPRYPKSHIDLLNLGLLGLQVVLFLTLPRSVSRIFFFFYFAFWRAAYDAGLGWVLTKQSKKKWIVKEVQKLGWLDETRRPAVRDWIRKQLAGKMGKDYSFDVCVILLNIPEKLTVQQTGSTPRIQYLVAVPSGCRHYTAKVSSFYAYLCTV